MLDFTINRAHTATHASAAKSAATGRQPPDWRFLILMLETMAADYFRMPARYALRGDVRLLYIKTLLFQHY